MPTEAEAALRSIRGHSKRVADATVARDRAIRAARAAGVPLHTIGEAAGVNHQTVQNIVDRAPEPAPGPTWTSQYIVDHVQVRREPDGSLWATVDEYPGVFATGADLDELGECLREAMALYLAD